DVGAKRAIYQLIHQLAGEGLAVLLVSSEIEEVLGLSHKVLAIRKGRIAMELDRNEIAEDKVMKAIFATDKEGELKCTK
ncbi:MAG: sugar ABC transporter ATP-binding protein, partial [Dethiobacteria bacterium]|nr:sugar ABC transporter ATP-binding protein [Dethiobacteria bacterium]